WRGVTAPSTCRSATPTPSNRTPGRPGVRLLGVGVADLQVEGAVTPRQGGLFAAEDAPAPAARERRGKLLRAMDAIRDRHGEDAVHRGGERRSTSPWGPNEREGGGGDGRGAPE
ncbi:MAG: hypothetical protein NXI31_22110, partial [bacterium]|nr:hypothetical protein [bacterium]